MKQNKGTKLGFYSTYITQNLRIKHAYTGTASEVQGGALAEFYKGVMDRLQKRIQWVRPTAFCSRDFFLLHDDAFAHTAASACQFLTP
jgi:chemotaxis signal transduction protein